MSEGNGTDLQALLIDNPKVLFTAIRGEHGALHLVVNGTNAGDIKELCTAYYLIAKNIDVQIQKILQGQKPNIVVPKSIIERLQN